MRPAPWRPARPRPAPREAHPAQAGGGPRGGTEVRCPHFPDCVGCPLVGQAYGAQLRDKAGRLAAALAAEPALAGVRPEKIVGSPEPFGYRNQAKLVFRGKLGEGGRREVMLGIYRPGTHHVMPAHLCAVHDPRLRPVLAALRAGVEELGIRPFDERNREGVLRYALARISRASGAIHLTLVAASDDIPALAALLDRLRRAERRLEAVFLCVNSTPGNSVLSGDVRRLFGPRSLVDRFGRLDLESRPDAFVQANVEVATRIYAAAEQWLDPRPGDAVLDVFGGVGGLGLAVGARVRQVLGVESSPAAVECANANARRAHLRAVRYVAGSAEELAALAAAEAWPATGEGEVPGRRLAIVNPPRKGLPATTRAALADLGVDLILYLSCDPETLARDLADLGTRGYGVLRVRPFDMLPQTPHVEVLALLGRAGAVPAPAPVEPAAG